MKTIQPFKIGGGDVGLSFFHKLKDCIWRTDIARVNMKGAIFSCSLCGYSPDNEFHMWFKNDFYSHYYTHFIEYMDYIGIDSYDGFYLDHNFFEFSRKNWLVKVFQQISKD